MPIVPQGHLQGQTADTVSSSGVNMTLILLLSVGHIKNEEHIFTLQADAEQLKPQFCFVQEAPVTVERPIPLLRPASTTDFSKGAYSSQDHYNRHLYENAQGYSYRAKHSTALD